MFILVRRNGVDSSSAKFFFLILEMIILLGLKTKTIGDRFLFHKRTRTTSFGFSRHKWEHCGFMYGKDESVPKTNIIKPTSGKYAWFEFILLFLWVQNIFSHICSKSIHERPSVQRDRGDTTKWRCRGKLMLRRKTHCGQTHYSRSSKTKVAQQPSRSQKHETDVHVMQTDESSEIF